MNCNLWSSGQLLRKPGGKLPMRRDRGSYSSPVVSWIAPGDGLGGQPNIGAPARSRKTVQRMIDEVGGSDYLVAFYATSKCGDPSLRSKVVAFLQIGTVSPGTDLSTLHPTYSWNQTGSGSSPATWDIGYPIRLPWLGIPAPLVDQLNQHLTADPNWKRLQYSTRSGPRPLEGDYRAISDLLTQFVRERQNQLYPVRNSGDAGVAPGAHRW